ncbi:MAG: glycosyltransferase [Desulfovibrio sp.]|jgi:glycosyltransferase involved in cell wall biosynthesis|nr:glycosyltransferase [Desulfovibrio sp.]
MKKFVILDPSIKRQGGHYLEYADRVLDAAQKHGFETLVVGNRAFTSNSHRHQVIPWFHRDFFEDSPTFPRYVKSQLGKARRVLKSAGWCLLQRIILHKLFSGLLVKLMGMQAVDEAVVSGMPFFHRSLSSIKHKRVVDPLCRLTLKAAKILGIIIVAVTSLPFLAAMFVSYVWQSLKKPGFASDLKRLLDANMLQPGDLVFIPTAGLAELRALNLIFGQVPLALKMRWRILFRRDLIEGKRASSLTADERQAAFRPWRKTLYTLRRLAFQADIAFFTDTEELTTDYNALGAYAVKTTVIPVAPELHVQAPHLPATPLTALYLGDARDEKGFHLLPPLIRRTRDLLKAKRLRYVCQSNFNIPGGEKASSRALAQLREIQAETAGVQLLPGPFTASEYQHLIQSAAIIMLPYMPENYLARSSGVFAEALAAGVPCLIPAGTSMARQAEPFRQEHFRRLCESDAFSAKATYSVPLRELLSGYTFVSDSVLSDSMKASSSRRKCIKISWPHTIQGSHFLRVEIKNYDSRNDCVKNSVSQTVALKKGSPGCAVLGLSGDMHQLTISFSPQLENPAFSLSIELRLLETDAPWPRGAGVGIYEDTHDMEAALRDLTNFYEHHRQAMVRISSETWPLFHPDHLVSQLSETGQSWLAAGESNRPRIMFWSELSVGYGSPQVPSLAESMRQHYQADVYFLAADEDYRPITRPDFLSDEVKIDYVFTSSYAANRFFSLFKSARYGSQAVEMMEKFKPEMLVVTDPSSLLYLQNAAHKPKFVIFYHLELASRYHQAVTRAMAYAIDCVIFPERNRASLELRRLGLDTSKTASFVMHNSRKFKQQWRQIPASERNGHFIYAGGFWHRTNTLWLLEDRVSKFPVDIFGSGGPYLELFKESKTINFYGYIPSDGNFFTLLGQYAYSLILWSQDYDDTYYCAPNKLYDALTCGVPFISGPHPLCQELAAKYNCGLIMPDWSLESFVETLEQAQKIFNTEAYQEMIEGCRHAMREECDWDMQFSKLAALLPSAMDLKEKQRR